MTHDPEAIETVAQAHDPQIVQRAALAILRARFYDSEPDAYESVEAFDAKMLADDGDWMFEARHEATAALDTIGYTGRALDAAAMREASAKAVHAYGAGHGWHPSHVRDAVTAIIGLPSPSPADLLAEALKVPEVAALREALEPFARADRAIGHEPGPYRFETGTGYRLIERDDLSRARTALAALANEADHG